MAQKVVLAVGLPGSGKSTWFERRGIVPLSSDHLRLLLADDPEEQGYQKWIFLALRSLLRTRLRMGRAVSYVDATSLTPSERRPWIQIANQFGCRIEALYFDVPLEVCLDRNRKRRRKVPVDVMRRMAERLIPPSVEEGFSRVMTVKN
jgi:predicted kinase